MTDHDPPLPITLAQFLRLARTWHYWQTAGDGDKDQCGVDLNDQRRHLATEALLRACNQMWPDVLRIEGETR